MSLEINKAKSYLGFAIKSRAIKFGVDDIIKMKSAKLIIVSDELKESSEKKILSYSQKNNIELLKLTLDDFQKLLDNNNIKAVAITDENLAAQIKKNLTNL